ncbi:pyruvate kinase [Allorhodopirellula heiligendammensis]|uniref:Pyruvate kinase n=1 Tax=Allorhodopirellula heiligendammensis TaxID=2714739 RepID=A0A5C6BXI6_9BACT|nr:pyruvate kinase [Allorhodopirellula heiligendammensis]TWU16588.1 Pyruvate kinase [Allorhodopirellula heiligendammensis]
MSRPRLNEARTKIVATVGPACDSVSQLAALIEAGVDVFRINSAHGSISQHAEKLANIREASEQTGFPAGVLLDLAGPKIRLGHLSSEPLACPLGARFAFVRGNDSQREGELTSTYPRLIDELEPGDRVMLADGMVALQVESVTASRAECVVVAAGEIRSRQGVNLPGVKLSVAAMLPSDIENAIWAAQNEIDFISLSFVRTPEDVRSLKDLLNSYECRALVIAKIEKPEALANLERIVQEADGIMVARGDLGVEIDVAETPVAQKRIIATCKRLMKPVIVATQMLESMHHSPRPTRAEASDVANAVLDGTDACMLSGETAIGSFPQESVATMDRIMYKTEQSIVAYQNPEAVDVDDMHRATHAITRAGMEVAEAIGSKLITIATHSGGTAWVKSNTRSLIPTVAVSDHLASVRRMNLFWGIEPIFCEDIADTSHLIEQVTRWACDQTENGKNVIRPGDTMVVVSGSDVVAGADNVISVHTLS